MITIENLVVRRNGRKVLSGLSHAFQKGSVVAVVGPNGAGKSTLLRALAGLGSDVSGTIELDGIALDRFKPSEVAKKIAYLPQDHHVSWPITVRNVVALGRMPYVTTLTRMGSEDTKQVTGALRAMAIEHLAERAATTLSGGELARTLVARMLAQDTAVLLADEPAAGLDPAHGLALFEHFRHLANDGRLVIVATHDLSLALRYCDHVLLLKAGELIASGPARDVLTRGHIEAAYSVTAAIGEVGTIPVVVPLSR